MMQLKHKEPSFKVWIIFLIFHLFDMRSNIIFVLSKYSLICCLKYLEILFIVFFKVRTNLLLNKTQFNKHNNCNQNQLNP